MLPTILEEIGRPRAYWEPFLGGGSVLLAKPPSMHETVSDLHPELINLIAVLASTRHAELGDRLERTIFSETVLADVVGYLEGKQIRPATAFEVDDEQLEIAYATFVKWWMGRGGTAGGPNEGVVSIRMKSNGGAMPSRFRRAVGAVEWLHRRLERVGFYCRDALEIIAKIEDREGTVIYADPTFIGKDKLYSHALQSKGDDASLLSDDHDRLAELLNRFQRTRVVLRYYRHERLETLYASWRLVDCTRIKHSASPNTLDRSVWSDDILLVNQEPVSGTLGV
jgi:DNA adenine methylase